MLTLKSFQELKSLSSRRGNILSKKSWSTCLLTWPPPKGIFSRVNYRLAKDQSASCFTDQTASFYDGCLRRSDLHRLKFPLSQRYNYSCCIEATRRLKILHQKGILLFFWKPSIFCLSKNFWKQFASILKYAFFMLNLAVFQKKSAIHLMSWRLMGFLEQTS